MNRLLMLRRAMMSAGAAIKKFVVSSASGIVSFVTNVAMPTKITCEFSPVQSGTGDPSPSNVRPISGWTGCEITQTGYNLINLGVEEAEPGPYVNNKRILQPYKYYPGMHSTSIAYYYRPYVTNFSTNGQSCSFTLSNYTVGITFPVKGGTRIKGVLSGTNCSISYINFFDKEWNVIIGGWGLANGINVPENAIYAMARIDAPTKNQPTTVTNFTIAYETGTVDPQLFSGNTLSVNWKSNLIDFYSAYSGKSGITMTGSDANGYTISGLASAVRNAAIISVPAELSGKTLQLSVTLSPMENGNLSCAITNTATGTVRTPTVTKGNTKRVTVTFEATATTKIQMDYGAGDKQCSVSNIMLCEAGQVDYLPYGMGGVYGGTLTINEDGTGTLVSDLAMATFDGSNDEDWGIETALQGKNFYVRRLAGMTTATSQDAVSGMLSNRIPVYGYSYRMDSQDMVGHIVVTSGYINYPISSLISIDNLPDFLTWLASNNLQLTYKLATPVAYNLTAEQVNSIVGTNNIWHDMNGGITVEYYNKQ